MPYSRTRSRRRDRRRSRWPIYLVALLAMVLIGTVVAYAYHVSDRNLQGAETNHSSSPVTLPPSSSASSEANAPETGTASPSASPSSSAEPTPEATVSPDASPTPSQNEAEADHGKAVTLAFVGDILPASGVATLMEKNGVDYPFALVKTMLQAADFTAGNLEAPITTRGTPAENKSFVFKGKPEYLVGIKNAGFDVLSLANNHTLDQGWEGLNDTMDALDDAKLQHMGSGNDDKEAFAPVYLEKDGIRIAYIGVSNVLPEGSWKAGPSHPGIAETYDTTRSVAAIQAAKKLADIVVVMVHWGTERADLPKGVQTSVGHTFIDAGADLIIGSHPHVLQGFEAYKGKWIAYSLGNFIFTTKSGYSKTNDTGILTAKCTAKGNCALSFNPLYSQASQPGPMEPANAKLLLARLSQASFGAKIDEEGVITATSAANLRP